MRTRLVFLSYLFCLALPVLAQQEHPAATSGQTIQSPAEHDDIGWAPRELLERPVSLRDGLGPVHQEVTTSSLEAQKFYDQGLAYLHSYVWIEAALLQSIATARSKNGNGLHRAEPDLLWPD